MDDRTSADEGLTRDAFLGGKLHLWQPAKGFRAATDPVLLAAACPARPGQTVLDLGTGVGSAALCLAARVPGLTLTGLELQPLYADLARRNAAENAVPFDVVSGDLAHMPAPLRRGFDHVIANPPYYPQGGTPAADPGRALSLQGNLPLAAWVDAAARRLTPGGTLTLIFATDGLTEVLAALGTRLGSPDLLPLTPREGRPALRLILRARKGGRAALRLLPPLILHSGPAHDGDRESYASRAIEILRHGASLDPEFA
jgi:tRNA1(Val) A37 N6-methylase TrmN6